MSKFKKVLLMCTAYVLVAALAIGGTVAYLTSEDSDVNVMTMGNVKIEQIEQQYDENGNLVDFEQDKPLYPYVGTLGWENTAENNGAYRQFTMNNVVDKYVSVKNTGKSDAYVRTFVALEMGDYNYEDFNMVGVSINKVNGDEFKFDGAWEWTDDFVAEIDGQNYNIMVAVHKDVVASGETTIPSLLQVYLSKDATNETVDKLDGNDNGTYDILVFSEAVQVEGFADAKTALNTAFGDTSDPTRYIPWSDGPIHFPGYVYDQEELTAALAEGGNVKLGASFAVDKEIPVSVDSTINGNGYNLARAGAVSRSETAYAGGIFNVAEGATLELTDIVVDGGAVWSGEENVYLQRGTENIGVTATGALITANKNSKIILGEGAVLQNNCGANAVNLGTRIGATLTLNGGEIINNYSAAGAIWGGGAITVNSGKINGNHGGIGGAIRVVTNIGTVLTMNGGEMNHNVSDGVGGAIWAGSSKSSNTYVLNGGEMAYNYSPIAGGAMYAGYYETVKIGGNFKMHHNSAPAAAAIRFHDHASLIMTGGEIYENGDNSLFLYNNAATITGGKISDTLTYSGGLGFVWGEGEIESVAFNLGTNHNTAYLKESFNTIKFTVNETAGNFSYFNFKPAEGYVYAEGDENKLICLNDGYTVVWDAATATFCLTAE